MLRLNYSIVRKTLSKFQIASDLHHDSNGFIKINIKAANLLIAGDFTNSWNKTSHNYIKNLASDFDRIIMVPGNHEYYNPLGMDYSLNRMRETESLIENFILLDNESYTIDSLDRSLPDVNIFGTTLWSHIPVKYQEYYKNNHYDFKKIYHHPGRLLTPQNFNQLHQDSLDFLQRSKYVIENIHIPVFSNLRHPPINIFMSHHSPLINGTCHPKYIKNRINSKNHAFCSDLGDILRDITSINYPYYYDNNFDTCWTWVFGHTHYNVKKLNHSDSGFRLTSNPLGFVKRIKNHSGKMNTRTLDQLYPEEDED